VCTKYTLWVSDRVVQWSDRAGFRTFPRESSVCQGGNAVRVPPRAQQPPRQRGFCFNVCTSTGVGPSDACRGWCLAAAVTCSVIWVEGSEPWLVSPPPAGKWGHPGLLSGWLCWAWLVLYLFMSRGPADDMTCRDFLKIFSPDSLFTGGVGESWPPRPPTTEDPGTPGHKGATGVRGPAGSGPSAPNPASSDQNPVAGALRAPARRCDLDLHPPPAGGAITRGFQYQEFPAGKVRVRRRPGVAVVRLAAVAAKVRGGVGV
jgi:hypothetical protein